MSKSLIYYVAKIKEAYPQITKLSIKDYEALAQIIVSDMMANKTTSKALPVLYSKLYSELLYLAKFYAKNNLDEATFSDNLSATYLYLMNKYQERFDSGNWYKDYNNFIASTYKTLKRFAKLTQKESQLQKQDALTTEISDLAKLNKYIHSKNSLFVRNKLKEIISSLNERDSRILSYYYGLNGGTPLKIREIAEKENLSNSMICQILHRCLKKIYNHPAFIEISEHL